MSDSQQSNLLGHAAKITELTRSLTTHLREANFPEPTFAPDSVTSYVGTSSELFLLRQSLLDSLMDMWYLVQGPSESIFNYVHSNMPDSAALTVLNRFDFWSAVPLDGSASYAEIAGRVSLPVTAVQRLIEHGTTLRLFEFVEPGKSSGRVRHTSRSAALVKSPGLKALVSTVQDDAGPSMAVLGEALERYSRGQETLPRDMSKTAFAMLHSEGSSLGHYKNSWEMLENDGEGKNKGWRQRNFVEFMAYLKDLFQTEKVLEGAFDWKAAGNVSVVDVGGSGGHDSFALAQKHPDLRITVQDLPEAQSSFDAHVPASLQGRVTFMPHNFFEPQPLEADVYVIKLILHDWPDAESVAILKGLTPALKPGARVVFIDYVGKQDGVKVKGQAQEEGPALPRHIQNMGTATDLRMMALFAAEERPVDAWTKLFKQADERYDITRVEANPLTFMVVIEAVWRG